MKATNIRKGNIIRLNSNLYRVLVMDHVTPGKGRAHIQTKLRNIIDGTQTEMRFRSDEDVEKVAIESKQMQYLYKDQSGFHFMDTESYEQVALADEHLGDAVKYRSPTPSSASSGSRAKRSASSSRRPSISRSSRRPPA